MAWARATRAVAAALAVAVLAAGCSWRLETEPEAFRTPSPVTVLRDQMAAAEAAVGTSAAASVGPRAHAEAAAVTPRLSALGGVSPTSSPRAEDDFVAAVAAAQRVALECMEAAGEDPLAALCASIALSHAAIAAVASPLTASTTVTDAGSTPTADSPMDRDTIAQLALEHDRARAMYEVMAARSDAEERDDAFARSAAHLAIVEALLAIPGIEDPREPAYDIPAASVATAEDRGATALAAEAALAETYAALLVAAAPADRPWLLNAALDAYVRAADLGLTAAEVPALPGTASAD